MADTDTEPIIIEAKDQPPMPPARHRNRFRRWIVGWLLARQVVEPHECGVLTCDRARFWRDRARQAEGDADRFADQLTRAGLRPAARRDGNEAGFGYVAAGR